ncbi:MAG TPA: IS701 family transposase [Azospirillum sp.]|nr:IS701 family transposase [Azospirillum sp.]
MDEAWTADLERWLAPFLERLAYPAQRHWAPLYIAGLLAPGERKSLEPLASRVAPGQLQQLHHFLSTSRWDPAPLEEELVRHAQALVGGPDAVLVVDDTALVKKGEHSVGVAHQYCGQLGKQANCQSLVSLTLARAEVPVCVALRLFLPEAWIRDEARRRRALVPEGVGFREKWRIALAEIDRVRAAGATFGTLLGDADYGRVVAFRHALDERGLTWALAVLSTCTVYPADVRVIAPTRRSGQPRPDRPSQQVQSVIAALPPDAFRAVTWRRGSKGPLRAEFAALRIKVADGPPMSRRTQHLPGAEAWLVCERRANGEQRYYLSNLPPETPLERLAERIKARWVCEQAHQQMKEELGLDHLECRNWMALAHHALLTMLALCFLQQRRLGGKKPRAIRAAGATAHTDPASGPPGHLGPLPSCPRPMSRLPAQLQLPARPLGLAE